MCAEGPCNGDAQAQIRKFGANAVFEEMREWLVNCGCTHVVMESTGEYWRPIFKVLEEAEGLQIGLANSQQVKGLRGHKTPAMRGLSAASHFFEAGAFDSAPLSVVSF